MENLFLKKVFELEFKHEDKLTNQTTKKKLWVIKISLWMSINLRSFIYDLRKIVCECLRNKQIHENVCKERYESA